MSDSGPGRREVAYRLFAAEFDDAEFSYSESDEERAPNYVVTPTGARVNRLFAVGVLTEVEDVNPEMVRGRVVDPTGAFVTYAGQYQPDALAFLERAEPPTFLALSGKARTFEPDDGDRIYTSVRPESVSEVDAETRDRWVVTAAERTLERVGVMASAVESGLAGDRLREALEAEGVDPRLADGVALALEYYDTTPAYLEALRETALDAVRVVAGEMDEVGRLDVAPGEGAGRGDAAALATLELSEPDAPEPSAGTTDEADGTAAAAAETGGATTTSPTTADPDVETGTDGETGSTAAAGAEPDATTETDAGPDTGAVSGTDPTPEGAGEATADDGSDAEATGEGGDLEPESTSEAAADPEPEVTPDAGETAATADAVEGGGQEPGGADAGGEDPEDFDPGEFELDEEERREVEEEYGTEFSTADEVESGAGSDDDSETPTEAERAERAPTEAEEASADAGTDAAGTGTEAPEPAGDAGAGGTEQGGTDASGAEPDETGAETDPDEAEPDEAEPDEAGPAADAGEDAEAPAEEVVLEDAVMETMEELDDGDGADREELVSAVADRYGALPEDVEDALQDALMSGRCYEPTDGVFKSI